jgi:hypothetical protein
MIWRVAGSDSNPVVIPGLVQLGSAKTRGLGCGEDAMECSARLALASSAGSQDFCTSDCAGKTPQRPSPAKNRNY